jgi:hypothetical protein
MKQTDTYDKTRRVNLGLTPEPTNVSFETGPPIFGLIAVYAFGAATGFGIALLTASTGSKRSSHATIHQFPC